MTLSRPTSRSHCRLRHFAQALWIAALLVSSGCQTWQKSHEAAIAHFSAGELEISRTALLESQQKFLAEKQILELDHGIIDLASGNVAQAEARFRTLRRELEHLEQKDVTEQASSLITDSRAVAFSGRDFERRMILNMALLTSILGDGQDAFAYSLQVTEAASARRVLLAEAAKKNAVSDAVADTAPRDSVPQQVTPASFSSTPVPAEITASRVDQPLAFSAYLAAMVQSEQPSRQLETQQALEDIGFWNPTFTRQDESVSRGDFGVRCQAGHGTLHVITLIGKAPRWVSESAAPTTVALLIADRIVSCTGKHTLPPTIAAVKIARPEPSGSILPVGSVKCSVAPAAADSDSSSAALTFSTLVNLNEVAEASYQEHRDEAIAQAIARRILKKGAVYVLKETQKIHRNSLVDFGINVAGVAWEAMEKADTRSWRLLPARIDIARTELPEGDWSTVLRLDAGSASRSTQTVPVHIQNGRNTTIVVLIPERSLTGNILVGGADNAAIPVQQGAAR